MEKVIDISKAEWMQDLQQVHIPQADMNRLIMNYLITEGYKEAAEKFWTESGIEMQGNLTNLENRINIKEAILSGNILKSIEMINELHPELLDTNKSLYFRLLQQHMIELIRENKVEEALDFAQTHLAEKGLENSEMLPEIECTLALLAFPNPELSPFGELLEIDHRKKVASEVNSALLSVSGQEPRPKLISLVQLVRWAQEELDGKKVSFPHLIDFGTGGFDK